MNRHTHTHIPTHARTHTQPWCYTNLSFAQHIYVVSKLCFHNIRDLRRTRNTIDQTTACTISTYLIYSKIGYCNSLLFNLPATQTKFLQLVLNSVACAITKTPKFITLLLF